MAFQVVRAGEPHGGGKLSLPDKMGLGYPSGGTNPISSMPWSSSELKTQASGASEHQSLGVITNAAVENSQINIPSTTVCSLVSKQILALLN